MREDAVYATGVALVVPAVAEAIEDVRRTFAENAVDVTPDGQGGAYFVVSELKLGPPYHQPSTWLGFHVTYLHPAADVYPHYVRPDLTREDGQPLGAGFAPTTWVHEARLATQLSRKSNRWDPRRDTPALKALKVLAWLRTAG